MRGMLLLLLLLCASSPSTSREYRIEDLLDLESYGRIVAEPRADLLLVERRRPYRLSPDFGYGGYFNDRMLGRVTAVPLSSMGGGLRLLFPQEDDAGYWMGAPSPSGRLLTVFRLRARTLTLGVVDLRTRSVRWLDVRPDLPDRAPAPIWLDERRLLVAERIAGDLPRTLSLGSAGTDRLHGLDVGQARGLASFTVASIRSAVRNASSRLVELSIDGSDRRTLLEGHVLDVAPAPAADVVAVMVAEGPVVPAAAPIAVGFRSRRIGLRLVSMGDARLLASIDDVAPDVLAWSPGGRLLVAAEERHAAGRYRTRMLSVSRDGRTQVLGGANDLAEAPSSGAGPGIRAVWIGTDVLARARRTEGGTEWLVLGSDDPKPIGVPASAVVIAHHGGEAILAEGSSRWLVTARGASPLGSRGIVPTTISLDPFASPRDDGTGPCGPSARASRGVLAEVGTCGGGMVPERGDDVLAAHAGGLIVRRADGSGVQTLVARTRGRVPIGIDRINTHLLEVGVPLTRRLATVDGAGRRLFHWLLLPSTPSVVPPALVVQPYPGRTYGERPPPEIGPGRQGFATNPLLLASAGFAVLLPSMPTMPGRQPARDVVSQVEAAVAAARATGLIRDEVHGVMGHSFGAWAAMVLATRTRCLAGVVAANGVYDLSAAHATMVGPDRVDLPLGIPYGPSAGWTESGQASMGVPPWRAAASYDDASPIMRADRTHGDVLLVGGDLDPVDLGQTERMFMEIGRGGGRAELMRFWGEGHTVSSPDNLRAYWSAATSFLRSAASRAHGGADCRVGTSGALSHAPIRRYHQVHAAAHASHVAKNMSER